MIVIITIHHLKPAITMALLLVPALEADLVEAPKAAVPAPEADLVEALKAAEFTLKINLIHPVEELEIVLQ